MFIPDDIRRLEIEEVKLNSNALPFATVEDVVAVGPGRIEIGIIGRREIAVREFCRAEFVETSLLLRLHCPEMK